MSSRKSAAKSREKTPRKGRKIKAKDMKKKAGSKARTKARTSTRRVVERKREPATVVEKAAAAPPYVESPALKNDDTIEEVRSSVENVIDEAKKAVGVE
jgi:hypothetical protein